MKTVRHDGEDTASSQFRQGRVRFFEIFTAAGQISAGQRTVLGEDIQTLLDQ
jgi:hypothetical protein